MIMNPIKMKKSLELKKNLKFLFLLRILAIAIQLLSKKYIKDVSSRVLDLLSVEQMALDQFKIIERMGDLSSSDRKSILKNKYYLDDDYEDNMFILDWSYCRFFAPGAMVYPIIIKRRIISLRLKCFEKD